MATDQVWQSIFAGPADSADPGPTVGHRRATVRHSAPERFDVQGLRALAVVLVILDHASAWPRGGFVGVDVFFVISGYLITGLLVRSATSGVTVPRYFGQFYLRRARRILPAAMVVLGACWLASSLAFEGARTAGDHTDILWALIFAANVHFASVGTDYFHSTSAASIVQHFWSLAVEEQFYLLWPVLLLVVMLCVGRRSRAAMTALLVVVAAGTTASFVWAIHQTATTPATAYFSAPDRAWELGLGATLSVLLARFPGLPDRIRTVAGPLQAAGTAVIVASAVVLSQNSMIPAPAAAAPVVAAGAVLVAGTACGPSLWNAVLTNPVARYLGDISFSLYLWHWPVVIITETLVDRGQWVFYPMILGLTLGLAVLSYHFVEEPFRNRSAQQKIELAGRRGVVAVAGFALVVAAASCYTLKPQPVAPNFTAAGIGVPNETPTDRSLARPSAALQNEITESLGRDTFPPLDPPVSRLGLNAAAADWAGCTNVEQNLASCTFAPATPPKKPKIAVVTGDSIALSWLPMIKAALLPQGYTVIGLARELCPAAFVDVTDQGRAAGVSAACTAHHQFVEHEVSTLHPSLIVMSSATLELDRLKSGAAGSKAIQEYESGMATAMTALKAAGTRIVTMSPPPPGASLLNCDTGGAEPSRCVVTLATGWRNELSADRAAAQATGTDYLDTHLWFCSSNGYCPSFVGSTPVFYDGEHLTSAYATRLAPEFVSAVKQ